jgi:hypothetical protein
MICKVHKDCQKNYVSGNEDNGGRTSKHGETVTVTVQ